MLSAKGATVAASAMAAITLGAILQNQYLIALSIPLTLLLVLARLTANRPHHDIRFERLSLNPSIYEGETQTFTVRVKNNGSSLDFVEIVDILPQEVSLKSGSNHEFASLLPNQSLEFAYEVLPESLGSYTIGPIRVRCMDLFGLYVEEQTTEVFNELKVFPKIPRIGRMNVRPRRTRNWPGEIVSRRPGSGLEFYGIRRYMPSDLLKRINWRASARLDALQTNQFMSELGGDAIIIIDARSVSELGLPPFSVVTYSVRAAAIIAHRLLRDRNRVGMIIIGDKLDKIYPRFGRRQFDRILISLARTKPGSAWEIRNLAPYLSLLFSRITHVIVVTPLLDDDVFRALADIAAKGYNLFVVSPSAIDIEKRSATEGRIETIAEELVRIERHTKITLLRRHATVIDWNVNEPLSRALQEEVPLWARAKAR